ncbi:response regulator [Cohnella nanjingensis]|uniref:Response regulator transcription factor n=1 Tax=Cohnella nanjingensis TaxID=1387779 RepID=A0A7X0RW79_9BACL|nr:response regulator transcription factor [Cohnella nanjingensis]MBB6673606.1 response regulator transcription factor [Cohnella nanjingensis]
MVQPYRVIIIDDHRHAREAMRCILAQDPIFELVGEGGSGREAVRLAGQQMPDLILMDINMKEMDGLEATREIKSQYPRIKIVMVTISDDILHLFEALKKGASGYLMKNLNPSSWLDYLRAVALDELPLSRELAQRMLQEFAVPHHRGEAESLVTVREKEILAWVAQGASNKEIADRLCISEHTVKNHLKNILHKLHLQNRVQLARFAIENRMTHP